MELPASENLFAQLGPRPLLTFRAGLMYYQDGMVYPDTRKGLFMLVILDGFVTIQWCERETGALAHSFTILPGTGEYVPVEKAAKGRVYLLNVPSQDLEVFFWMQEVETEYDEEICEQVNKFINCANPALLDPSREQLLHLFGGYGALPYFAEGSSTSSTPLPSARQEPPLIEMSTLQGILDDIDREDEGGVPEQTGGGSSAGQGAREPGQEPPSDQ